MAIFNLFSKRKAAAERITNDVFEYEKISTILRSQLRQMYLEAHENESRHTWNGEYLRFSYDYFEMIVKALRREYGKDILVPHPTDSIDELSRFLESCSTDEFIDCAELYGRSVDLEDGTYDRVKEEAKRELNFRFREAGLGYEFIDGEFVRIDSQILHGEVLKPTLTYLSSSEIYKGAEQEIRHAFQKYRQHDNKDAVANALKAFESTMKAILGKRGWEFEKTDTASKLISHCFKNELIPTYLQTHLTSLKSLLESGVPTVRNKTSGHGQGAEIVELEDHFVCFALYTALANMKLLIECDQALN